MTKPSPIFILVKSLQTCCLFLILIGGSVYTQTTIWSEDFESYADGDTVAVDNNTANPAVDWSYGPGSAINKVFGTNPISGNFSFHHRQGTSTWTTETIDISTYSNVSISINLNEITCDTGDRIETYYDIDGMGPIEFGDGNGDASFGDVSNSIDSLNGDSLILTVVTTSDAVDDKHKFDDILIQGTLTLSTEPTNPLDNSAIYPNPASDKIYIGLENIKGIELLSLQGQIIYSGTDHEIDISDQPDGIYFISVITGERALTKKLIKSVQ